jgi:hypothetical protein
MSSSGSGTVINYGSGSGSGSTTLVFNDESHHTVGNRLACVLC